MRFGFKKKVTALIMALILCLPSGFTSFVLADDPVSGFSIFSAGVAADIYVDGVDHPQIIRAANDLAEDIKAVTGTATSINDLSSGISGLPIIVGSIEKSSFIQELISNNKLDEAKSLQGKWEAFVIKVVDNPTPGCDKALVIAGSDKRGAIYGIYDLSERIGVSPWYWWGDVPIIRQGSVILPNDFVYVEDASSVKYRGIFINDEYNLWEWSSKFRNDTDSPGQINPAVYGKVFELLLRLKMNTLWPAMHEQGDEFNKYTDKGIFAPDGTPLNAQLAHDYGIVMGTSHCEPLLTCPADEEWNVWARRNYGKYDASGLPVYDYSINPDAVMAYWRERVAANKDFEAIYTIGMRGRHDGWMGFAGLADPSMENRVALLQKIIDDQREMLSEVLQKPIEEIPQAFIPYKEAATYYNNGLNVPDDVILMWAEDNQGQLRQIPTDNERNRSGGAGVYYHVSVYGPPNSYLWLSTTPNVHMYEELRRAYDTDAKTYWVVNVGDIKPAEVSTEFFAELGRNIDKYNDKNIGEFYDKISRRDYGVDSSTAAEIGAIMDEYYQLASAKRPEYMGLSNNEGYMQDFSRANYGDEAQIHINRFNDIFNRAKVIYDSLPADRKDAFYQMIYYQIRSTKFMLEWTEYQKMNHLSNAQGRYRSTTAYRELSEFAYQNIQNDLRYYNKVLAGGKWDGMMAPVTNGTRIPSIAQPHQVTYLNPPTAVNALGSVCEGQTTGNENVTLSFSSLTDDKRFIDVFTKDSDPKDFTITPSADFIVPSVSSGTVNIENRIWVSIDFSKLTPGVHTGTVTVSGTNHNKVYNVKAEKFDLSDSKYDGADYIQANGYVAIEAEHFSNNVAVGGDEWKLVKKWGRIGDSMRVYPHSSSKSSRIDSNLSTLAARLEYKVYFSEPGTYNVTLYRNPSLNEGNYDDGAAKSARSAVSLNGAEPSSSNPDQYFRGVRSVYVAGTTDTIELNWKKMAYAYCEKLTATINVDTAGVHTVSVYKSDASIGFDRLVIAPTSVDIVNNSYFGPPESYNTKYQSYPAELGVLPNLEEIPQMEEVGKPWFSFGATVNNYINVSNTRIYTGNNGYGWNQATTQQTATGGDKVTTRDQQYQYGNEARTFTANMVNKGRFIVGLTIGHRGTSSSRDISDMSVSVNGETKLSGINVASGASVEKFFLVDLNNTTEMAITFTGSPWAVTTVEIAPYNESEREGDEGYFMGVDGTMYIEAEAALEESYYAYTKPGNQGTSWQETAGASGTAMFHGPNSNKNYNTDSQSALEAGPTMNYRVWFDEPGDYRIWVLRKALSPDDDSFHFGLNGSYMFTDNNDPEHTNGLFRWRNTGKDITIDDVSRPYTITIGGREDGITIDKIYLRKRIGTNGDTDMPCFQGAPTIRKIQTEPESAFFSESFDSFENGEFVGNDFWQPYGNTDAGSSNVIEIVDDPTTPGNKLIHMKRNISSGGLGIYNKKSLGLTGVFTIETKIMREVCELGQYGLYTYNESTFNFNAPQNSSNPIATVAMAPNGVLRTHNVRGTGDVVNVGTFGKGEWKIVNIVVNMDTGTYDYYVDGEKVLENQTLRTWQDGYTLDRLQLYTSDCTNDHFYADYVNVYKGEYKPPQEGADERLTNPIVHSLGTGAADPWVIYKDGYYYYCKSLGDSSLGVAKARRLQDIGAVPMVTVYTPPAGTMYSKELWAPELLYLKGKWYIYFAADDGNNDNHRMYVLESDTQDPQGSYTFKGKITSEPERWAIDGTVLEIGDEMYFVWSGWEGTTNVKQDIYIAHMSDPWTIDSPRVLLSSPEYPWECVGNPLINEGPQILKKNGKVFIVYSASVSWLNEYCLGMLTLNEGDDPLDASKWIKSPEPVFKWAPTSYGTGHASFTVSPDGTEDWIVFHAFQISNGGWNNRSVRAQKFGWTEDGMPDFGDPLRYGDAIEAPSGTPKGLGMATYTNALATIEDVADFTKYGGTWLLGGDTYNVENGSAGGKIVSQTADFTDFVYEADVAIRRNNTNDNAGLIFRVNSPTNGTDSLYGYYAGISANDGGFIQIGRFDNNWNELVKIPAPISLNTTYRLKVEVKGKFIKLFIDGKQYADVVDDRYVRGSIGFRTFNAGASISNINVEAISGFDNPKFDWSWVKGAIYVPTNAVNQIEQWTNYDPAVVERELYAGSVYGINFVRVYLHNLLWEQDSAKLLNDMESFLSIADKYGIKTEFVLFDDCWNPDPQLGDQGAPEYGIHNSRWVQGPGNLYKDHYNDNNGDNEYKNKIKSYVQGVVSAFKDDPRIAMWNTFNEPGNGQNSARAAVTKQIMNDSRIWIAETGSQIPITATAKEFSGRYFSDFYTWHSYDSTYPLYDQAGYSKEALIDECLNRGTNGQNQSVEGIMKNYYEKGLGFVIWELGIGRDNCRFAWSTPVTEEPLYPFHGLVYPDGHPWSVADVTALTENASNLPVFSVEYYNGKFAELKKSSITPLIAFDLGTEKGTASPDGSAGVNERDFSIRWTGTIKANATGNYTFFMDTDNIASVTIDGNKVIEKNTGTRNEVSGSMALTGGEHYQIVVEYYNENSNASAHLSWSGPGMEKQILKPVSFDLSGDSVTVSPSSLMLELNDRALLAATVEPFGGAVTWQSSDVSVATVDATGNVVAVAPGVASISATATSGISGKATVIVTTPNAPTVDPPAGFNYDHFNGSTLDPAWSIEKEDASKWSLISESTLRIVGQSGDMHQTGNSHKNVFLREAPQGDFSIITRVSANVTANYMQAGLVVWQNQDNYVRFGHVYNGSNGGKGFEYAIETNASYTTSPEVNKGQYPALVSGSNTVYLKITKRGNTYTSYVWNPELSKWIITANSVNANFSNPKVGLYALGTGANVQVDCDFEYFAWSSANGIDVPSIPGVAVKARFQETPTPTEFNPVFTIANVNIAPGNIQLIAAAYDNAGELVDVNVSEAMLLANGAVTLQSSLPIDSELDYKFFIWDEDNAPLLFETRLSDVK